MDGVAGQARKRIVPCGSALDIISNLPSNIIDKLLISLPIQDAARTSVLSKKWRYEWLYVSQLVFDDDGNSDNLFHHNRTESVKIQTKVWSQMQQILLLHRGCLHKFRLCSPYWLETERPFIDQTILFLARKDIQELTLSTPLNPRYRLSSTLFKCKQLTHLSLSFCVIRLPSEFVGFGRLVNLDLISVDIVANDFNAFISKCPILQNLKVTTILPNGQPLEIDAPNLKLLYFNSHFSSILFKNVPALSSVQIKRCSGWSGHTYNSVNVFDSLPAIEYLLVDPAFLLRICMVVPRKLPNWLNRLNSLELLGLRVSYFYEVLSTLLLIKSSPDLQKLKIKVQVQVQGKAFHGGVTDTPMLQFLKGLSRVKDSVNRLQEVTIEDVNGTEHELEFVKFILANALVLKKIIIQPPKGTSAWEGLKILTALSRFERASPKAELVFSGWGLRWSEKVTNLC